MPWNQVSDGIPSEVLRQFALCLNEVLCTMYRPHGVLEKHAFVGDMARRFLASVSQGRDGVYHTYGNDLPTPEDVRWPNPLARDGYAIMKAFVLSCKIELSDPTDGGCAAFEAGLMNISPSSQYKGQWYHTRATHLYGGVLPNTSTYRFCNPLAPTYFLHVVWDTASYPPWDPMYLTYPENVYIRWETRVPVYQSLPDRPVPLQDGSEEKGSGKWEVKASLYNPLVGRRGQGRLGITASLHDPLAAQAASAEAEALRNFGRDNRSKGKGRAH